MAHEYTNEEVTALIMSHVRGLIRYWETVELDGTKDTQVRLEGLAFSIFSMLDGSTMTLPEFIVAPNPHPLDHTFLEHQGKSWFPMNFGANVNGNLGGSLYEKFSAFMNKYPLTPSSE